MPLSIRRRLAPLAGLVALLLLPAGAHAATPAINVAGAPTPARVQAGLDTGAKQLRFFVSWADLEPDGPGTYGNPATQSARDLSTVYDQAIEQMNAAGAQPIFVVLRAPKWANGSDDQLVPPTNPTNYGTFLGAFAAHNAQIGQVAAYEVWNEPDDAAFWHPAPDAAAYEALLHAAHVGTQGKTSAALLTGATTGSNYDWMEQLYDDGAQGNFDGVAVHTDTACLVNAPDQYYRDNATGRIGQYPFLSYREMRATMLSHGDDKPIWMTELGWSSTNGGPTSCQRGDSAGTKASGVSETEQAKYLTEAYGCLANDPYVVSAGWFTLYDDTTGIDEVRHYGLLSSTGAKKPAYGAFQSVAAANGGGPIACGDFSPPSINVVSPTEGQQFVDKIDVRAAATDVGDAGLGRITFTYDGGKQISSVTKDLMEGTTVGLKPWQGSGDLALGPHTIEFTAVDLDGNTSTKTINVVKVAESALAKTLKGTFKVKGVKCAGAMCTFKGSLGKVTGQPSPTRSVAVQWQFKNRKHKYVKVGGGLKSAGKPFTFKYKPKLKGSWRVRVVYAGVPPYKAVNSKFVYFKFR